VVYTLGRLAVFLVVAGLLHLIGFRSFALVLIALLVSMPLSFVLLRGPRTAMAQSVQARARRRRAERERLEAALRREEDPGG